MSMGCSKLLGKYVSLICVLTTRGQLLKHQWEKDRQSKRVEMALAAKVAKISKGPTQQKASEEKSNKSLVYCNCACKLTNKSHFYHFKRYIANIYI